MKELKSQKPIKARPSFYSYCFYFLKEIASNYGYNLVLHGSLDRDLDLIAIPWEDEVGSADKMVYEFAEWLGGSVLMQYGEQTWSQMPQGRRSYIINMNRGGAFNNYSDEEYYLDIAVMPTLEQKHKQ
jgi:hypothetical protein